MTTRKELSAMFLSQDKFDAALTEIAHGRAAEVRLFHNEPPHTAHLLAALAHPQCQVRSLDIYTLDNNPSSAGAMHAFLSSLECGNLTTLAVRSCEGGSATAAALGAGLAANTCRVHELSLTGMADAELAAVLQPLAQHMQHTCPSPSRYLTRLSLTRCHLGPATCNCAAALACLQHLELTDCVLPDAVAAQLLQQGLSAPLSAARPATPAGLQTLSLCGTQISSQAASAISELLAQPWSQLHELQLNNNPAFGDAALQLLAVGVHASQCLQQLQLCQCAVGPQGAEALAAAIAGHNSLRELCLDQNQVGAAGMLALLQSALGTCPSPPPATATTTMIMPPAGTGCLEMLRLEANGIKGSELPAAWPASGPQAAGAAACALRHVSLAHNFLSDSGVALLQQALAHAPQLRALDLQGCGVGPAGAGSLVEVLAQHSGLRDLRLDHNRLHDAGAQLLLPAVQAHPGLQVFRAEACRLIDVTLKARITDLTMQLAARAHQQAQQAAAEAQQGGPGAVGPSSIAASVKLRQGTRFPAKVYQRGQAMEVDGSTASTSTADSGGSQPYVLTHGMGPAAASAPVRIGGRRMGSRFAPEAYLRPVPMDEDHDDDSAAGGGSAAAADGGGGDSGMRDAAASAPAAERASAGGVCGKHMLGVEEREQDPRAGKAKDGMAGQASTAGPVADVAMSSANSAADVLARAAAAGGGGGSGQGSAARDVMMRMPVHPFRDNAGISRTSLEGQPMSSCSHSWDDSLASCSSSLSLSPRSQAAFASSIGAVAMHTSRSAALGSPMHAMEGNHSFLQSCSSLPMPGAGCMGSPPRQAGKACLVLRPSAKRRSYKPLTPQQQAMFDVF